MRLILEISKSLKLFYYFQKLNLFSNSFPIYSLLVLALLQNFVFTFTNCSWKKKLSGIEPEYYNPLHISIGGPDLQWFNLGFFGVMMEHKRRVFSRNHTWKFEAWSLPPPAARRTILAVMPGSTYSHSMLIQTLCSAFSER